MLKIKQGENSRRAGKTCPRQVRVCSASSPHRAGFAVLFAVLLASFLITLGISIFNISLKEIQIVTSARDSQIAYYVADSARECALYWDIKQGVFPACLSNNGTSCDLVSTSTRNPTVICNSIPFTLTFNPPDLSLTYSTDPIVHDFFKASSTSLSAPIADISISKTFDSGDKKITTTITAYGHNTSIIGRRVERGIRQINN